MAEAKAGEWYWGAKCPQCGKMAAHSHDPTRGQGNTKPADQTPGAAHAEMQCPDGHRFSARTENLLRFEWGAQ
jgi:hypothetical protein